METGMKHQFTRECPSRSRSVVNRVSSMTDWSVRTLLLAPLLLGSLLPIRQTVGQQSKVTNSQGLVAISKGRQLSLADQLRAGLKAKTVTDKRLVAAVVIAVEQGRLPRKLVDSTFLWARKRSQKRSKKHALRPIVYFQPALLFRAKKLGIKLPNIEKIPSVALTRTLGS